MEGQLRNEKVNILQKKIKVTALIALIFFFFVCRYDDKYTLTLNVRDAKGIREASVTKSCANFIDTNGFVFENLVANEVNRLYNSLQTEKKDK